MPANFGFVTHAAKRSADEFAFHRPRNGLSQGSFAHAGRSNKTQDHAFAFMANKIIRRLFLIVFAIKAQFANRKKFKDAVFYIFKPKMIFVQDFARMRNIKIIICRC